MAPRLHTGQVRGTVGMEDMIEGKDPAGSALQRRHTPDVVGDAPGGRNSPQMEQDLTRRLVERRALTRSLAHLEQVDLPGGRGSRQTEQLLGVV